MSKRLIYYHHAVLISSDESKLKQGDCLPGKPLADLRSISISWYLSISWILSLNLCLSKDGTQYAVVTGFTTIKIWAREETWIFNLNLTAQLSKMRPVHPSGGSVLADSMKCFFEVYGLICWTQGHHPTLRKEYLPLKYCHILSVLYAVIKELTNKPNRGTLCLNVS